MKLETWYYIIAVCGIASVVASLMQAAAPSIGPTVFTHAQLMSSTARVFAFLMIVASLCAIVKLLSNHKED